MSLPVFRHQDPAPVGMSCEVHAEHVEHFALEPVRAGPDRGHRRDRLVLGDPGLHAHATAVARRVQAVDHIEAFGSGRPIAGRHVGAQVERGVRIVAQMTRDVEDLGRGHDDRPVADPVADVGDRPGKRRLKRRDECRRRLVRRWCRIGRTGRRGRLRRMFRRRLGGGRWRRLRCGRGGLRSSGRLDKRI